MGITDDYDSLYSHALGTDTGGNAGGPAHSGGAPEIRKSQAAYKARSSKLQSLIYKHVEDASIKNTILEECGQLATVVAANAANAGGQAAAVALPFGAPPGTSPGQHALRILDNYGRPPTTGLTAHHRDMAWAQLSLRQVGYSEESMLKLKAAVTQLNLERPAGDQFTDEQCRIKFLSLIDTPQSLVDKAIEEMQRGSYRNAAGLVTLGETAAGFDEHWRVNFARGAIKFAAPPQQGCLLYTSPSPRDS